MSKAVIVQADASAMVSGFHSIELQALRLSQYLPANSELSGFLSTTREKLEQIRLQLELAVSQAMPSLITEDADKAKQPRQSLGDLLFGGQQQPAPAPPKAPEH